MLRALPFSLTPLGHMNTRQCHALCAVRVTPYQQCKSVQMFPSALLWGSGCFDTCQAFQSLGCWRHTPSYTHCVVLGVALLIRLGTNSPQVFTPFIFPQTYLGAHVYSWIMLLVLKIKVISVFLPSWRSTLSQG